MQIKEKDDCEKSSRLFYPLLFQWCSSFSSIIW